MPSRFLHMLRVFKIQSPMSVGSWTLMVFSSSAAGLAFLDLVKRRNGWRNGQHNGGNAPSRIPHFVGNAAEFASVLSGAVLSTYTGVLIGATAVPVWHRNVGMLPVHFGASGMGSAASLLELEAHQTPALNAHRHSVGPDGNGCWRVHRTAKRSRPEAAEKGKEWMAHADRRITLRSSASCASCCFRWRQTEAGAPGCERRRPSPPWQVR